MNIRARMNTMNTENTGMGGSNNPRVVRKIFDKRMWLIIGTQLGVGLLLGLLVYYSKRGDDARVNELSFLRENGNKLQTVGMLSEAISYYEEFFRRVGRELDDSSKAKLCYTIAELYEKTMEYERALGWYYLVEIFDHSTVYKNDAKRQIVSLLEKLKKFSEVKYALQQSTSLGMGESNSGGGSGSGEVVAKVGEKNIYLHEINEALDELPAVIRDSFGKGEEKVNFAKKYVSDFLLYQKGIRLKVDEAPKFRKMQERILRELVVKSVIDQEVVNKVVANESDVKNYFAANKSMFSSSENALVSFIRVKEKNVSEQVFKEANKKGADFAALAKKYSQDEESKAKGGVYVSAISADRPFIVGTSKDGELTRAILASDEGKVTAPILAGGDYFIFKIRKKNAGKEYSYEQIKDKVMADYRHHKEQELYQKLIDETLKTADVKLFLDKVK
ncbi:MAG: peptidyl-prolyl cis-trans isomerase [Oligoflexia bacterium]|nr:peptidyl-prolyl cis-trans isomerase [Oligoflexia bacterium]